MDPSIAPGPLAGELLDDRYRLLRRLPRGDGADVYEAEDQRLERRVEVHVARATTAGTASLDAADQDVLDAGDHDGHRFFVFALAAPAPVAIVGNGRGDEEPTGELPTATDRTAVLPVPLLPSAEGSHPPSAGPGPAGTFVGALWARRGLLVAAAAVVLLLLAGLAARNDGVEVPTGSSVPITAETTTTTIAPTTTSPPATEAPAPRKEKGKGKKGDDDRDD